MLGFNKKKQQDDVYDTFDDIGNDSDYGDVEPDNSRWELHSTDVLKAYEHSLRAERKDANGKWYVPEGAIAKMNEEGIFDTISDLQSIMHKGTFLGNISVRYCVDETRSEAKAYMRKLRYNLENWNVNRSQFRTLVLEYARLVFMSLSRSVNDKERIHRNKRMNFVEQYKHNEVKPDEIAL